MKKRREELRDSVQITILDALRWTEPHEVDDTAFAVLAEGLELLQSAPEAPEAKEEAWITDVLNAGWELAPSLEQSEAMTTSEERLR